MREVREWTDWEMQNPRDNLVLFSSRVKPDGRLEHVVIHIIISSFNLIF